MPYVDGVYTPVHNFVHEYAQGQKIIRADYMDEQFSDLADVLTDYLADITQAVEDAQEAATDAATSAQGADTAGATAGTAAAQAVVNNCVKLTGAQTIAGTKTFSSAPIVPTSFATASAVSSSTITVSNGAVFTKTISANTTFTFSGVTSGKAACFTLILTNGGAYTVTWPSSVKWADGDAPDLVSSGVDVLTFLTPNGGTTWYGVASVLEAS